MKGWLLAPLLLLIPQDPPEVPLPLAWKLARTEFACYRASTVAFDAGGDELVRTNHQRVAGIFGYEIAEGTRYRPASLDWTELPLQIGFSLPSKPLKIGVPHEWAAEFDDGYDYAPVTVRGSTIRRAAVKIDERDCAVLEIRGRITPQGARPRTSPKVQRLVEKGAFDMTLHFDLASGVARRLRFYFSISFVAPDPGTAGETFEQREELELESILPHRHKEFEREVNEAIDRGLKWIWRRYSEKDGHWGAHYEHLSGPTALSLLTILKGSLDRKDPRLNRAMAWMVDQAFVHTYDVAISIMAIEAYYSPKDPVDRFRTGEAELDLRAKIDPAHARWVADAAKWLAVNMTAGMWSYPSTDAGARDFSNTQVGVLGLFSAARCGAPIDGALCLRIVETYLKDQEKKGPRIEMSTSPEGAEGKTAARQPAEARGWSYYDVVTVAPYGSMTTAAISSLTILDALLRRVQAVKYDKTDQAKVRVAIRDGWAWLQHQWTVKGNPRHGRNWLYYYLYGLERCGMLGGVAKVGERDWYVEGATLLVSNQAPDGAWHTGKYVNIYDICFAVLFLKRATIRVATGK